MMKFRVVSLVLGAAGLAMAANRAVGDDKDVVKAATAKTVTLKKGDHVLFFGDSLTALAQGPKGYVTLVRQKLTARHPDWDLKVNAVATGGHTVPDLLKRLDNDVLTKKPTIVVIQIGCNDARRIDSDKFRAGLEELIDRLHKAGTQVIQCSLTTVGEKHDGTNKFDPQLEDFAAVARQVAVKKNVPLNDLRQAFMDYLRKNNPENKDRGFLTYDGNHFNDAGHVFVAEQMLKRLK